MNTKAKTLTREGKNRWCRLEVVLENGRLSICGSEGRILPLAKARTAARENWEQFFEDREELTAMNVRCGTRFASPRSAAKYVLDNDGEFHGLEVDHQSETSAYVVESCGQIRDELALFFPEAVPFFRWHLNDMKAECEHQETRGETYATHPDAACPDCGYKLGSQWLKRELPPEVAAWVDSLGSKPLASSKAKQTAEVRP